MSLYLLKRTIDQPSVVICDHFAERIVNRLLQKNCITFFCVSLHCHRKCEHHARCLDQPFFFYFPSEMLLIPSGCCLEVIIFSRCCREIHICHPERKHIITFPSFFCEIIFQAFCSMSVHYFIKIELHLCILLRKCLLKICD